MILFLAGTGPAFGVIPKKESTFVIKEDSNVISISNGLLGLKFSSIESGLGLYSISNLKKQHEFLLGQTEKSGLWEIEFQDIFGRIFAKWN